MLTMFNNHCNEANYQSCKKATCEAVGGGIFGGAIGFIVGTAFNGVTKSGSGIGTAVGAGIGCLWRPIDKAIVFCFRRCRERQNYRRFDGGAAGPAHGAGHGPGMGV